MREEIQTRSGIIEVVRWSNGKITIEAENDMFTPVQARKVAAALVSCAKYRAADGYSTKAPHPERKAGR